MNIICDDVTFQTVIFSKNLSKWLFAVTPSVELNRAVEVLVECIPSPLRWLSPCSPLFTLAVRLVLHCNFSIKIDDFRAYKSYVPLGRCNFLSPTYLKKCYAVHRFYAQNWTLFGGDII